jgi:predicted enzyme related to lactoylglutathione lyase
VGGAEYKKYEDLEVPHAEVPTLIVHFGGHVYPVGTPDLTTTQGDIMHTSDHGRFCWYDLMTTDRDASLAFYTALLDWHVDQVDMGDHPYSMIFKGDRAQGGIVQLDGDDTPTHWIPYIAVDDLAAACNRAAELGGQIFVPATDVGPGAFAMISDPQGGVFSLWKSKEPLPAPPAKGEPGTFCWSECLSSDAAASQTFYEGLFGWRTETADMEIGGNPLTYRLLFRGDSHFGGILTLPEEASRQGARTHWLNYVNVADVDASAKKAVSLGATVLSPTMDIPGAGRFSVIQDPQGGMLALFRESD